MKIKRCSHCGRYLGETSFYFADKNKVYRKSYCKKCDSNRCYLKSNSAEYLKKWREKNKYKNRMYKSKRRAAKKNQTALLTDNEKRKIETYYMISRYLGDDWHVDHVISLSKGGLHPPDNLMVITAEDNLKKNNKINYEVDKIYQFKI